MYLIMFGKLPWRWRTYVGREPRPYKRKAEATRFRVLEAAEARVAGLRLVWAKNPSFDRRLIEGITIVEVADVRRERAASRLGGEMRRRVLLSVAAVLGCSAAFGQVFTAPQPVVAVPVAGGSLPLGGYWGYGLPVVPQARYPSYYQGYFDAGIGAVPVSLGNIVTFGGILYLQNADGTLTLFR